MGLTQERALRFKVVIQSEHALRIGLVHLSFLFVTHSHFENSSYLTFINCKQTGCILDISFISAFRIVLILIFRGLSIFLGYFRIL